MIFYFSSSGPLLRILQTAIDAETDLVIKNVAIIFKSTLKIHFLLELIAIDTQ